MIDSVCVIPDSTFSSLNKKEKLKSLKSNIDSQLIPDDPDATVESIINSILYDQKFHKLEDELATTDKISEFGKFAGLNRFFGLTSCRTSGFNFRRF